MLPICKTVVTNTSRDLNRANIPFTSSNTPKNMYIRTNDVDVTVTYEDPITWNTEMLRGIDAVYGKKELMNQLRESMFRIMPPTPSVSFIRYLKMNSGKEERNDDLPPKTQYIPEIKNVYFNEPMTIVMWADGTKTMVQCQDDDVYSAETGLAVAIAKKALGNKGNFNNVFKKLIPKPVNTLTLDIDGHSIVADVLTTFKEKFCKSKEEKKND